MSKKLIQQILEEDPRARDDDTWLTAKVWAAQLDYNLAHYGSAERTIYEMLQIVTDQETIKRTRRQLHQQGKIKYSEAVENKRYNSFKDKTAEYSTKAQETIRRMYGE